MARLGAIPEYRQMFEKAYPGQRFSNMNFAHASNAIAGFFLSKLTFDNSPWDRFLAGNDEAMTPVQLQGAKNFMSARCSVCHNGGALTDNQFPQRCGGSVRTRSGRWSKSAKTTSVACG